MLLELVDRLVELALSPRVAVAVALGQIQLAVVSFWIFVSSEEVEEEAHPPQFLPISVALSLDMPVNIAGKMR